MLSLAFSPDGATLAVGFADGVRLLEGETGQELARLPDGGGGISALVWSPDGRRIAGARYDGVLRLWEVTNGKRLRTLRGHIGAVNALAWSPDGAMLASAGDDLTVRIWDAETGEVRHPLEKHRARVTSLAWSPDGAWLVSGGADRLVLLWDARTGRSPNNPQGHRAAITAIAFNTDGSQYATASADGSVRIWRAGGQPIRALSGPTARVIALAWRGELVNGVAWDGKRYEWDSNGAAQLEEGCPTRARSASFGGNRLACTDSGGQALSITAFSD